MHAWLTNINIADQTSHGFSFPRHEVIHGGGSGDPYWSPPSARYKMLWLMRNEDFFVLRWSQPEFVRAVIAEHSKASDGGFIVGSEGYIPPFN